MIKIGEYQKLTIKREMPQGFYLSDEDDNEVLMPQSYITKEMELEQSIEVFVYCDSKDYIVATTEKPFLTVGEFATLTVNEVNNLGAFCKWGVASKELFIPYRNQAYDLEAGDEVVVHMYLDKDSDRLVGTTKLDHYLKQEADERLRVTQEVEVIFWTKSNLGFNVVVDNQFVALVYANDVPSPPKPGEKTKGFIKNIREDGKIDVTLFPVGHLQIAPNASKILEALEQNDGFLPYHDKSDAEDIKKVFGLSKKMFKKALGSLYKQKLITIETAKGIRKI